jgi:hypothetical protein
MFQSKRTLRNINRRNTSNNKYSTTINLLSNTHFSHIVGKKFEYTNYLINEIKDGVIITDLFKITHNENDKSFLYISANTKESVYTISMIIINRVKSYIKCNISYEYLKLFYYTSIIELEQFEVFGKIVGSKFMITNKIVDEIGNDSRITKKYNKLDCNELVISSNSEESVKKIINIINSRVYNIYSEKLLSVNNWNSLDHTIKYIKNHIINILSNPIDDELKLIWINNNFQNIFKHDIFVQVITKNNKLIIDFMNKIVIENVLNPEDEEDNLINNYNIQKPIYDENIIINEPKIETNNNISKLNIDAKEFIPNSYDLYTPDNTIQHHLFLPAFDYQPFFY